MHPHMLRHTFVTTMLDAGVDLRDVQIAARHADPRTTMRYDRARKNLDRHPTTSSPPTWPPAPERERIPADERAARRAVSGCRFSDRAGKSQVGPYGGGRARFCFGCRRPDKR